LLLDRQVAARSTEDRDRLIQSAMAIASNLHHEMDLIGSRLASLAPYRCRRCGLPFAVGYEAAKGSATLASRRLDVIDRAALITVCQGSPAIS